MMGSAPAVPRVRRPWPAWALVRICRPPGITLDEAPAFADAPGRPAADVPRARIAVAAGCEDPGRLRIVPTPVDTLASLPGAD